MESIQIIKASGEQVLFDIHKLQKSLKKSGARSLSDLARIFHQEIFFSATPKAFGTRAKMVTESYKYTLSKPF